jgi:hypothetical protein
MLFVLTIGGLANSIPTTAPSSMPTTAPSFVRLTDGTIHSAVSDWCAGGTQRDLVESTYGPIANWDTAFVTKMNNLFQHQSTSTLSALATGARSR